MSTIERNSPEYHNAHLAFAAARIVEAAANREPILGLLRAYREDVEKAAADQAADEGAVERVARAICDEAAGDSFDTWRGWIPAARAAIHALRGGG